MILTTWQYQEVLRQLAYAWGTPTRAEPDGKIAADRLARGYQMAEIFSGEGQLTCT